MFSSLKKKVTKRFKNEKPDDIEKETPEDESGDVDHFFDQMQDRWEKKNTLTTQQRAKGQIKKQKFFGKKDKKQRRRYMKDFKGMLTDMFVTPKMSSSVQVGAIDKDTKVESE